MPWWEILNPFECHSLWEALIKELKKKAPLHLRPRILLEMRAGVQTTLSIPAEKKDRETNFQPPEHDMEMSG